MKKKGVEIATFANGCFWCTEAVFNRVNGVEKVISGYTGGELKNPSYQAVAYGETEHAEAIQIHFDPEVVSFNILLEIFFATHDPTTLNRQGYDVGKQYRSAVFYHNEKQQKEAKAFIDLLEEEKVFDSKIVTEITAFDVFYSAEEEHQNYYEEHTEQRYCQVIINPKINTLKTYYSDKLKEK